MSTNGGEPDEFLGKGLKEWRVNATLPPHFQEQVWRRIEQAETRSPESIWSGLQNALAGIFARRAWATSYIAVALLVGLSLGFWHAHEETSTLTASLGRQYVQSVDPYQKPTH